MFKAHPFGIYIIGSPSMIITRIAMMRLIFGISTGRFKSKVVDETKDWEDWLVYLARDEVCTWQ